MFLLNLCRLWSETRRGGKPLSSETEDALSVGLIGPRIAGKRIQRPLVVRDLLAGRPGDDPELARQCGAGRRGHAGCEKGRPSTCAWPSAHDPATTLGDEVVQRSALRIHEDGAQDHVG